MSQVNTFAWCALSALVGFGAGGITIFFAARVPANAQLTPTIRASGSESVLRPPEIAFTPAPPCTPAPPRTAPPATPAVAQSSAPAEPPQPTKPPAASPGQPAVARSRGSLLSAFRFAGIGEHGGVRLGRVARGTLPDLLGLKTGDEIITLNGLRIAEPQKAMQAYAQLPYVDRWVARIHRDGVQTEVSYALR